MSFSTIFQKLVPREKKFFPLFESLAGFVVKAAEIQRQLLEHLDPVKQKDLLKEIKLLESEADQVAQLLFEELDKTFLTPFDREDIQKLTSAMDSVLDLINKVSQQIRYYKPMAIPPQFKDMAIVIEKGANYMNEVVKQLPELKKPNKILKTCRKMSDLETESDELYHTIIADLFKKEKDAFELIKKKDILDSLEQCSDRIEDVSDVIKTIIIKMT